MRLVHRGSRKMELNVRNGWKTDIATERLCVIHAGMTKTISCLAALAMLTIVPSAAAQGRTLPVCHVSADAAKFIGKRVRVEGYIFDLSSHGFVLASKRNCKGRGQLGLWVQRVADTPVWRKAFTDSGGPKRAVLVGVVRWNKLRYGAGRNPALTVERVVSISSREADPEDF